MGDQSISPSDTEATLWASNFQRPGYGFAGWNDKYDYTGNNYGPNETISFTAGQYSGNNKGLSLYAIWVPSAGNLQSWNGCNRLNIGDITALTDARDNNTYAVAKLADNKCWMIENLRLNNQYTTSSADIAKARGYNSSFIGLADSETSFSPSTKANSLYSIDGSTAVTISSNNPGSRFPRYNNQNTTSPVSNMTEIDNQVYSMGNYYTWAAAIADTSYITSGSSIYDTSICPTNWHLPTGGNASAEFGMLDVASGGNGLDGGSDVSNKWRSYPNNFIFSGEFQTSASRNGYYGAYWSSTPNYNNTGTSYTLDFISSNIHVGTASKYRDVGYNIRCMTEAK